MKGLEDMPMRAMEERIRDAFGAAAETVTAQDLPGLPTPARRSRPAWYLRAWAPRMRTHALVPAAAAACVAAIIVTATLVVPKLLAGPPGGRAGAGRAAAAFARVPRYFVALTQEMPGPAVIGATATGTVLGTVAPPRSYPLFTMVAAARDDRTFVFAAARPPAGVGSQPARLYRLVLRRSGHPGRLTPLPIPPVTGDISGLAVSPDGSKLAVSVLGSGNARDPSKISVFSLATGAERDWPWPGKGRVEWVIPGPVDEFAARSLSWEADNRTLLFEVHTATRTSYNAQARLLDTAAPAGSLLASSTPVPIPSAELAPWGKNPPIALNAGPLLLTGDGTRIVAVTWHTTSHGGPAQRQRTTRFNGTISEFSVGTGKPVQVVYGVRLRREPNAPDVFWVNDSGTVMIASHPLPGPGGGSAVVGVQTLSAFTPLPAGVQHYFLTGQPAW